MPSEPAQFSLPHLLLVQPAFRLLILIRLETSKDRLNTLYFFIRSIFLHC